MKAICANLSTLLLITLSVFFISGCDSSGEGGDDVPDSLFPLSKGTTWTAEVRFGSSSSDPVRLVAEVTDAQEATLSSDLFPIYATGITFSERDDGLILETETRTSGGEGIRSMFLKYPAEPGDSYLYTQSKLNWDVDVSEETRVTVPAGTFDCIVYTIRNDEFGGDHRVWIAPGVGPVRWLRDDDGFRGDKFEFDYQLVSTNAE